MSIIKKSLRFSFTQLVKISPVQASKILYYKTFKKTLNLKNVQTFNEKLMWLKLYEDDSLKTKCTDKYLVRDYVREAGYSHALIDLYKVYESVEDINFQELPNSFVMKCTHGSGYNIICPDKEKMNLQKTISQLKKWMKMDYSQLAAEPHYSKIKPRIIVEKFLGNESEETVLIDYKIHCFHGKPQVIEIVLDRGTQEQKNIMMNCSWEILPYNEVSMNIEQRIQKPEKLKEMLGMSKKLSEIFTYVRVDLYFWENKVYFGELTFTPGACLYDDLTHFADHEVGKLLDLTVVK